MSAMSNAGELASSKIKSGGASGWHKSNITIHCRIWLQYRILIK